MGGFTLQRTFGPRFFCVSDRRTQPASRLFTLGAGVAAMLKATHAPEDKPAARKKSQEVTAKLRKHKLVPRRAKRP